MGFICWTLVYPARPLGESTNPNAMDWRLVAKHGLTQFDRTLRRGVRIIQHGPLARMTRTNQKCCHALQGHNTCFWTCDQAARLALWKGRCFAVRSVFRQLGLVLHCCFLESFGPRYCQTSLFKSPGWWWRIFINDSESAEMDPQCSSVALPRSIRALGYKPKCGALSTKQCKPHDHVP